MTVNSRAKGSKGERELARILTGMTGCPWRRSQQRRGTATSDVEADGVCIHVECKRIRGTLHQVCLSLIEHNIVRFDTGVCMCALSALTRALKRSQHAHVGILRGREPELIHLAMRQADRDRHGSFVPLIIARQDGLPWLACWREAQEEQLRDSWCSLPACYDYPRGMRDWVAVQHLTAAQGPSPAEGAAPQ